jgi:hypothetical protein
MPGNTSPLNTSTLRRLRTVVQALHAGDGRAVPLEQLVRLAGAARLDAGLTIDFEASRDLGLPLVVVRLAATPRAWRSCPGASAKSPPCWPKD